MGLDVKKILDDINPSKEVMKWIIVALCTILASSFIYQKVTGNSSADDIKNLKAKVELLEKKTSVLDGNDHTFYVKYIALDGKVTGSITNLKNYFDKRLEFVISNEDDKNKKFILSVLDMGKVTATSLIPNVMLEKSMAAPKLESDSMPAEVVEQQTNTIDSSESVESVESVKIDTVANIVIPTEQKLNKLDTIKKPGFLKRFLKIK